MSKVGISNWQVCFTLFYCTLSLFAKQLTLIIRIFDQGFSPSWGIFPWLVPYYCVLLSWLVFIIYYVLSSEIVNMIVELRNGLIWNYEESILIKKTCHKFNMVSELVRTSPSKSLNFFFQVADLILV